jgi:hypothetical protein
MMSFADSPEHQELLNISKQHLDALDRSRVRADAIIGVDNASKLKVATVFAATAIEAALNDYILSHCLPLGRPYLQDIFGDITKRYLFGPVREKIQLLRDHWPDQFPSALLNDVRKLFEIRNRIMHRTGEFLSRDDAHGGNAVMKNRPLTNDDMQHMLRHYDIAHDFLSRFWFPGSRELEQPAHS